MEKLPSKAQCLALLKKYKTFPNIYDHVNLVAKIAKHIAQNLKKNGVSVDVDLVYAAAMLHDISKSDEIRAKNKFDESVKKLRLLPSSKKYLLLKKKLKQHVELGYIALKKEGYPKIALIVRKHGLEAIVSKDKKLVPKTWEEKIVYYADKRTNHGEMVDLKKRLKYIRKRYAGRVEDKMDKIIPKVCALEKEILIAAKLKKKLF